MGPASRQRALLALLASLALACALAAPASARILIPVVDLPDGAPIVQGVCINLFDGTGGADQLGGSDTGDVLTGNSGNDSLDGLGGDDCLIGDSGSDKLYGADGNDDLRGKSGSDLLAGGSGIDALDGGSGRDLLRGGSGSDMLMGGGDRDRYAAGSGDDTIDAMDGTTESVDCGGGADSVTADKGDRLSDCERVKRR